VGEVNLIHTAAAIVLVAVVITLAAFALVNLVNATTALGDRLQLIGTAHSQARGEAVAPGHSHNDRKDRSTMKRTMTRIGIGAVPAKLRTQAVQAYAELLRKGYAPADIFYGITRTGRYRVGTTDGYSIALGGAA
jgi:hypothetical protein